MSDNALESQGIKLSIAIPPVAATPVFTEIVDAKNLNFRTGSASVIDTTDLRSTAKHKRMGLPDEGQCTFTLNFIPKDTSHDALLVAKKDRQKRLFRVELTDASPTTKYEFYAYVLSVPVSAAVDGVIESNVTLEITGDVLEV